MWLSLALLVAIPALLLADLFLARHPTRGDWMLASGLTAAYLLFVTLVGRWDFFSTWLPWLYFALFVLALYLPSRAVAREPTRASAHEPARASSAESARASVRASTRKPARASTGPPLRASAPVRVLLALSLIVLLAGSWVAWSGRAWSDEIPSFVFPLGDGTWFIAEGGGNGLINRHHDDPGQRFALDIVKLNRWGAHGAGPAPRAAMGYAVFDEPVYSPCDGTVLRATDEHPDRSPPPRWSADEGAAAESAHAGAAGAGPSDVARSGNHVVLECDGREGIVVVLAHLREGSLAVSAGDAVAMGDRLGRVGNSGSSPRPHLHVHVERAGTPGVLDGEAMQVQFEGRHLVRGQVVRSIGPGDDAALSHPGGSRVYRH